MAITRDQLNPRYIATLAVAALLILIGGFLVKPESVGESARPTTETVTLQSLTVRSSLVDMANFLSQRGDAVAPHLVYLTARNESGVVWGRDTLLAAAAPESPTPVAVLTGPLDSLARRVRISTAEQRLRGQWAFLAARRPDGQLISNSAMYSGTVAMECGAIVVNEMIFGAPVTPAFVGGGLFDMDGLLLGMVVRCDDRPVVISAEDVRRLVNLAGTLESRLLQQFGAAFVPLSDAVREPLQADSGVVVTDVWAGTPAARAGLRPGDVVVEIADQPVRTLEALAPLLAGGDTLALTVRRDGRPLSPAPPANGRTGLAAGTRGIELTNVARTGRAWRLGFRPGDRILEIGGAPATAALVRATLGGEPGDPVFVTAERGDRAFGLLVQP